MNLAPTRPTEAITRLRSDAHIHAFVDKSVHYYDEDSKGHGNDIEALLAYVEQLEKFKTPDAPKPCHSVLEVMMILQLSCCDEPIRNADFPAQRAAFHSFVNQGLIVCNSLRRSGYSVTEKGQSWCNAILSVP